MMPSAQSHPIAMGMYELENPLQDFIPDPQVQNQAHRNSVNSDTEMKERELVQALRNGDEAAFSSLIERYHTRLLRLARGFVPSQAVAEEVVQETWLAVLEGIAGFEGRSSLKTWFFHILTNRAKTRGQREKRYVPFSEKATQSDTEGNPPREPERFRTSGHLAGHWAITPTTWHEYTPERLLLSKEALAQLEEAIQTLPANQRQVMVLRDIEGIDSEEICKYLNITPTNQRVLLHRARSKVRWALNQYFNGPSPTA